MVNTLSFQYARALFDLAKEHSEVLDTHQNLVTLIKAIDENQEFLKILLSPKLTNDDKKNILKDIFRNQTNDYFLHFLYVLIDNNRFEAISSIEASYKKLMEEYQNTMDVDVYTKYELNGKQKKELKEKLDNNFSKNVVIHYFNDANLLAGIKVVAGDKVLDFTLDNQMKSLKESIMKG